ncbi:hypothetical protein cypCar_00018056 [Cyprinus carpio]|nr:hypothetical protein cypCar_00018056 [Cyprinus carpio]
MSSLSQEIQGFSAACLRKQSTRVTTVTGERFVETRRGDRFHAEREGDAACGFVQDSSLDLQVGIIRPFLLLSSQDAAHDIDTLKKLKGGVVLVHCNAGVSRSASVVIGFLMSQEKMSFDEAFSAVKTARPYIQPNPGFMSQLKKYNP